LPAPARCRPDIADLQIVNAHERKSPPSRRHDQSLRQVVIDPQSQLDEAPTVNQGELGQ
jgi:hypothetical protein